MAGIFSSCSKWLDYQPKDKETEDQVFSSVSGYYSAVNGVYNRMSSSTLYGGNMSFRFMDLLAQYYVVGSDNDYYKAVANWDYTHDQVISTVSSIWSYAYSTIMNANIILKNIEESGSKVLHETDYNIIKGEMLAVRAMIHLDMLRLFGPIYKQSPDKEAIPYNDRFKPEVLPLLSSNDIVKNYIIRDLAEAQSLLLKSDPVIEGGALATNNETGDNYRNYRQFRLNYYASVVLAARAYLWIGDMKNALQEARKITDDPNVEKHFPFVDPGKLLGNTVDPDRMFSTEILFGYYDANRDLKFKNYFDKENSGNNLLVPRSTYVETKLFGGETGDYRNQAQWAATSTSSGSSTRGLIKYKGITTSTGDLSDGGIAYNDKYYYGTIAGVIRLTEAYYIAAEACFADGETHNETEAYRYINKVRTNRGLTEKSTDFNTMLTREYQREFAGEGQTFFYFKRLSMDYLEENNGAQGGFIFPSGETTRAKRYVIPLPEDELKNR